MPIDLHDLAGCAGDGCAEGFFNGCLNGSWRLLVAILFLAALVAGIYLLLRNSPGDIVPGSVLTGIGALGTIINIFFWWKAPPENG